MPSPSPDPQVLALITAYQAQTAETRGKVVAFITSLWVSLGVYRNAQIAPFVNQVVPVVTGAEQHVAALTASYLATYRQLTIGGTSTPVGVDPASSTGTATRNGVSPAEVYERPFHQVWRDLADGVDPDDAIARGLKNATTSALSDLQRTKVLSSHQVVSRDPEASWYERVLEGDYSCGLCIVASTQRYSKATLLPMHPGCDCGVAVGYGSRTGQLNLPRLQDVHQAIEDTFGKSSDAARNIPGRYVNGRPIKYRDVLVVHEHGELGPVLRVRGHKFTGPTDLAQPLG